MLRKLHQKRETVHIVILASEINRWQDQDLLDNDIEVKTQRFASVEQIIIESATKDKKTAIKRIPKQEIISYIILVTEKLTKIEDKAEMLPRTLNRPLG